MEPDGLPPVWRNTAPNAQRCIDPFHVVSWAADALDQVRREAWSEAHRQAKNQPRRKPDCPAKGKNAPKEMRAKAVKNLRYARLPLALVPPTQTNEASDYLFQKRRRLVGCGFSTVGPGIRNLPNSWQSARRFL